jgi:hypothetical protein
LAIVDSILPETEVKEEPIRRAEPEPLPRKTPPKVSQPPAEQKPVQLEEKKTSNPEPSPKPAVAEKPAPQKPVNSAIDPLNDGNPIAQLQNQWSKMINEAPDGMSKTPTAALLRSARPTSIENDTIVVSVKHQYHKEKMDSLDNQRIADKIVSSFMGRPCKVRCVYEHENNHLVKAAQKTYGAQVIDTEETK